MTNMTDGKWNQSEFPVSENNFNYNILFHKKAEIIFGVSLLILLIVNVAVQKAIWPSTI